MAEFGTGAFGTSGYGLDGVSIGVILAEALSTNSVRVTLSAEPRHNGGLEAGGALNPQTWLLTCTDTAETFTLLGVAQLSPTEYELVTLEPLRDWHRTHRVASTTLLSALGAVITAPSYFDFPGVVADETLLAPPHNRTRYAVRDLANPQFPASGTGGTLHVGSDGDYQNVVGDELVRKLLLRRLTTPKGAFFHLKDYGVGLGEKDLVVATAPAQLAAEVERQARLEPEVEEAKATVDIFVEGVVSVKLLARTRTGSTITVSWGSPQEVS